MLAHSLARSGRSWIEAAKEAGYPDAVAASLAVTAYLSRAEIARVDGERAAKVDREVERLDYLQSKWWHAATEGDLIDGVLCLDEKAANIVLKVILARAKLLGLDVPTADAVTKIQTIVINGTSEEYIAGLKALSEGED